jgi:DNA-binding CsgD family transcriptional regulator
MRFCGVGGNALLSARELDVVRCVAEGLSNREIAHRLTLREHTVKNYLFRIFDKLGVSSRVEVVLYALGGGSAPRPASSITPNPMAASSIAANAIARQKKESALAPVVARSGSPFSVARH